ncbi:amino acid adenylation domain-containing protein [Streptomyces canus]|uniref:amino acid adenylation domain-containing protein n=1 Tax=Streptomyces canus TaxID=58343 RepID=UPI00368159AD
MNMETKTLERIAALPPEKRELLARRLAGAARGSHGGDQTIPRRPAGPPPLSFAQQRLWFLDQLDPHSPHYNIPMAARIPAAVDAPLLERSMNDVVRRHESLRTTFSLVGDGPVQVIHDEAWIPLEVQDLTVLPAEERERTAEQLVAEHGRIPFDLETGPLLRIALLKLGPEDHILMASMHHIIADTASISVILTEASATYEALIHGQRPPLAPLAVQYADYAHWQREWLKGEVLERQIDYWRNQLSGELPTLELPTDRPRPVQPTFQGSQHEHYLAKHTSAAIDDLAAREHTAGFTVLLAAVATLLRRYSGSESVCIGSPISNRARKELQGMVGYLSNTVLLKVDLDGNPTFQEAVRRAHEVNLGAQSHQDLPFDKIVEIVQPERDRSGTPLIQVMFVYRPKPMGDTGLVGGLPGLEKALNIDNGTSKFDLTFSLQSDPKGYRLAIEYSSDLFDEETVVRMADHFESLITAAVAAPDTPIEALPLLTADERRALVVDWNDTTTAYPQDRCLHELFEEHADGQPDAIAVSSAKGSLTYAELDRRANQLAHHLRALGAGPDTPVAISMEKSLDLVVGLLAIVKAGSAYLPLDPAYPADRLGFMLTDSAAPILLTQEHLRDALPTPPGVRTVLIDADLEEITALPEDRPHSGVTPQNLAYLIYTSGSTGKPKGVLLEHQGRVNNFHDFNTRFAIGPGDCTLALASSSFDMSAYDVFGSLMAGARISLPDPGTERDPFAWLEAARRDQVTVWHSVPALLEMLTEVCEADAEQEVPPLRLVLLGGDWIPLTLPGRIRALAPGAEVISLGGATEVSMDSTIFPVGEVDPAWRSIPYGKPMANQRCFVLDKDLQPVPVGVAGDLYLGGVGVGRGYLNNPQLTTDRFLPCPLPEWQGERIYRTGDRARYRADGNLELLGRSDFQVKLRGWRIEPGEVEAALRAQPGVKEAVVSLATDPGGSRLVGHLVPEADTELDPAAVKAGLREELPDYMVPSAFLVIDRLPLSTNGKIDRRRLPEVPADGDEESVSYIEPGTRKERTLAGVWQEMLGAERIGVHDNFFALGGDSIKAIQVITRARKLGLVLTPKQLFQHQTIAELAAVAEDAELDTSGAGTGAPERVISDQDLATLRAAYPDMVAAYPLMPMQRHMVRRSLSEPRSGQYIIQADYLFVAGALDPERISRAWQMIVDRHPILRTSYVWEGLSEPTQVVHAKAQVNIVRYDWKEHTTEEQLRLQNELVAEDRAEGFDLTAAPLLRLHLMEVAPGVWKYLSSNHHILLDGWSRAIVQQEVFAVYQALMDGVEPELPRQRSYEDYVNWTRARGLSKAADFWRGYLDGFERPTPLVAARGRKDARFTPEFAKQRVPLRPETSQAVANFCRRHQLTVNTVIQGAWFLLLSRYTGDCDVVLGVTSSGRSTDFLEVDTVTGLCMNTLPVRVRIDPAEPALPWLAGLQAQQLDLRQYEHTSVEEVLGREMADMFECQMVFENFPWDGSLQRLRDQFDFTHPLSLPDYQVAQFEFPLRVEVVPGQQLLIMHYYPGVFDHETVTGMIADWQWAIEQLIADPDGRLGAVLDAGLQHEREEAR